MAEGRRLAAIMFTDMVGYSAISHRNEILGRELVNEQRKIVREAVQRLGGREHQTTGDGFLIEFPSAVDCVQCAIEIQTVLNENSRQATADRKISIRIGIHLSDIIASGDDLFGNGINLAARIEPLAAIGGICITRQVLDQVRGKIPGLIVKKMGHRALKNIERGAEVYQILPQQTLGKNGHPWWFGSRIKFKSDLSTANRALVSFLFLSCLAFLMFTSLKPLMADDRRKTPSAREPAEDSHQVLPVDLSSGWRYQVARNQTVPLQNQVPSPEGWRSFDPKNSWKYADEIRGKFWLETTFASPGDFRSPSSCWD